MWHRASPRQEFVERVRVARAISLVDSVRSHRPPLVVVALQADLEQVIEPAVFRQVLGWQMAMIVEDRLALCEVMIEPPRGFICQKEIFSDKRHWLSS